MDKLKEIAKIQSALKIPITDIIFHERSVEIISGNKNIGSIPFYDVAGIYTYDNSKEAINLLDWIAVYEQNKNEIDNLLSELTNSDETILNFSTFRRLYVKDKDQNLIMSVICSYEMTEWTVTKEEAR